MTGPAGSPFAAMSHEPETVLHLGQLIRITDDRGVVLSGRVTRVQQLHNPTGTPAPWVITVTPEPGGDHG